MAFNKSIAHWIPGFSSDGTDITIPIASLTELTAGEVDATTGDIRRFLFALHAQLASIWDATAAADRPGQMSLSWSRSPVAGSTNDQYRYTATFNVGNGSREVIDES
jgi:hypothetical protein